MFCTDVVIPSLLLRRIQERIVPRAGQPISTLSDTVSPMSKTIDNLSETLNDDLHKKTRKELNAFVDETNALLAAGDAVHEDRTHEAEERLDTFLKRAAVVEVEDLPVELEAELQPPLAGVISDATGYVQSHPWKAVGAAAGIGFLVSVLLNRKQR